MRLLERRIDEIAPDVQSRIFRLSSEELETLGIALFDFTNASDSVTWLQNHNNIEES